MNQSEIFKAVTEVVSPVYLVGGATRDMLIGKDPKDYDFTTPLLPDEIENKIRAAGKRPYLTGKKFGTLGFKVDGELVEVTTFRQEVYIRGSRKPEVTFVDDLKLDLSRRDFTINAIAFDGEKYIDPFGGRLDILAKTIKGVGEVKDRFKEDPLRMLRAARFASQLGFKVDPNMIGKTRAMASSIYTVSRERWVQELDKLLVGQNVEYGFGILLETYLLKYMLPEVYSLCASNGAYEMNIYSNLHINPTHADSQWAALLMDIGKPHARKDRHYATATFTHNNKIAKEIATGICARLKFSNDRTAYILEALRTQEIKANV